MHYVYFLIDPRDNQLFYIGKGSGKRMYCHERYCHTERYLNDNPLKTLLIREILAAGMNVKYEVTYFNDEQAALLEEQRLIELHGRLHNGSGILTNLAVGGMGGKKPNKCVRQYTLNGEFIAEHDGTIAAALAVDGNKSSIQNAANPKTKQKSAHGFLWSYQPLEQLDAWTHHLTRAVTQHDKQGNLIAEFASIADASKATGIDQGNISACCSGTLKTAGRFIWKQAA